MQGEIDAATGVLIDGTRLLGFLQSVLWTSLRVGAALMTAPAFGSRTLPMRLRVLLALAVSAVIASVQPALPLPTLSAASALRVAQELAVGITLGLFLRLAFEAALLAGELVAQAMSLSFAQMADPLRNGAQSALLAQWFSLAFTLLFFAFDTHLALISTLAESYRSLPIGASLSDPMALLGGITIWFASVLELGVRIALPVVAAMLAVNIAFGLMSRSAPALNPIALGLPATLLFGLLLLVDLTTALQGPVTELFSQALAAAAAVAR